LRTGFRHHLEHFETLHEAKCMDIGACAADLSRAGVARAVDVATIRKLEDHQQRAEIVAARLDGLEQCPFCEFRAICDPPAADPMFACRHPRCGRVSCRRCKREHPSKSCEEHRDEGDLAVYRHRVEEGRSNAIMRICPKCKTKDCQRRRLQQSRLFRLQVHHVP
jgi:TRIAD3 protein (E3 ubiquitin-protein ligase RNF216)